MKEMKRNILGFCNLLELTHLNEEFALIGICHADAQAARRTPPKNQLHDAFHFAKLSWFRVKPALRPEDAGIRGEGSIEEESGQVEANIHAAGDKHAVERVALGRRDPLPEIGNRWEDAQAFSDTGLEEGELADFFLEGRTRYRLVGNVGVDFAQDAVVDERVGDDVEEDGANGGGRCV